LVTSVIIFGGEALEIQNLRPWFERYGDKNPRLINRYGITETTVHVTYRPITKRDLEIHVSPIGEVIPDLELFILDEQGNPVKNDGIGEIYVSGPGISS
jgi:non-ribosomal peptide synthetase component F